MEIRRVLEYKEFFNTEEELDVRTVIKQYNRRDIVRMAALLSLHYGNYEYPSDRNLFSCESKKYIPFLNNLFARFYKAKNLADDARQVSTYRTSLELWRLIFSIPVEEYTNTMKVEDAELNLFKVILALNEKIYKFRSSVILKADELIFLNCYLNNDSNNYELKHVLQPQFYYFCQLMKFIPTNEIMTQASEQLLAQWGLHSWKQYYSTIIWLVKITDDYFKEHQMGVPIIPLDEIMKNDETGQFEKSLVEHLCIDEDEYIPATYNGETKSSEVNVDFRRFRSKPFVKLKDGSGYIVINVQLLCERLYNSLFFDFMPLINGRKGSIGNFDYNKEFVEKVLFQNTFFKCVERDVFTWPKRESVCVDEDPHEPDFYGRYQNGNLLIMECKAIKMNGEIRDDADYDRMLDELHEKIVLKTRNLDPKRKNSSGGAEPIGIGQIIHHINSIEEDTFEWDKKIPWQVTYYPVIVFEDVKLLQPGLMSILNRWLYEELRHHPDIEMSEISVMPIVPISINTLFLYDDKIRQKRLYRLIDEYVRKVADRHDDGSYSVAPAADFDGYLRMGQYYKSNEIREFLV